MKRLLIFAIALIAVTLVFQTSPAQAYLDPGTGSILLQMLLGGVAGGLVVFKLYWTRIKGWFSPGAKSSDDGQGAGDT
ncbi:MAG: hypothetical protein HN725_14865 [Alphaproteobacteria bacterium]|nr:hypothetical protein [Alphaproteobacteria bacterium]MBT4083651.1 hypothetical protein [Alphaproteobacteria bacterium]MBT4545173.1 hypothetical protein [Alphaproteobacteria bacterium]MBT7746570.1 hypothetical protein [Alphaproteobacteria bacterium]